MEKVEPTLEVFYEEKKRVKNPWVPVGALLTAGVLTAGLISFRQGNSQLGQKLMRARVVAQGGTVALMICVSLHPGFGHQIKSEVSVTSASTSPFIFAESCGFPEGQCYLFLMY
ncbi:unnamed protein product [Prunus brigantina]